MEAYECSALFGLFRSQGRPFVFSPSIKFWPFPQHFDLETKGRGCIDNGCVNVRPMESIHRAAMSWRHSESPPQREPLCGQSGADTEVRYGQRDRHYWAESLGSPEFLVPRS